jgi:hypothetical protein
VISWTAQLHGLHDAARRLAGVPCGLDRGLFKCICVVNAVVDPVGESDALVSTG